MIDKLSLGRLENCAVDNIYLTQLFAVDHPGLRKQIFVVELDTGVKFAPPLHVSFHPLIGARQLSNSTDLCICHFVFFC